MDNKKNNPIELMLKIYRLLGEAYKDLTASDIGSFGNTAKITLNSSCAGQKIEITVSVEENE